MKKKIPLILTFIILIGLMFFYIDKKQGFHEDEIFSYGSSNYEYDNLYQPYGYTEAKLDYFWQILKTGNIKNVINFWLHESDYESEYNETLVTETPVWKTKEDALSYLTIDSVGNIFNFFSVWFNQTLDVHPPLFYYLTHIASSISYKHFSKYIIFSINLIFFILSLIGIIKIMKILNKEKYGIPTIILYGASMGAISTVMFQRMYMLLTFFGIWYLYYIIKYLKEDFSKKDKIKLGLIILGGFLTQYYFCIYVVLIFLIASLIFFRKKDYQKLKNLFFIHLISALIGIILFPASIYHIFFSYRGINNTTSNDLTVLEMFIYFIQSLKTSFSLTNIVIELILVLTIGLLIKYHQKINKFFYLLIIPIPLYIMAVSFISPFLGSAYTDRYIMIMLPIIVITFVYIISLSDKKYTHLIITIFSIALSVYGLINYTPTYLYEDYGESLELADENSNLYLIYVFDNSYTHLSSLEEFTIYEKHLIINYHTYDFTTLQNDEELNNQNEVIVCIKTWLDYEYLVNEIMENTDFNQKEEIFVLKDSESIYYRLTKES